MSCILAWEISAEISNFLHLPWLCSVHNRGIFPSVPPEPLECIRFFAYITYLLAYLTMLSTTLLNISTILILNFLLKNLCQIWAWLYACLHVFSLFSLPFFFFLTYLPMFNWKNVVQTKVTMLDYFHVWQLVWVSSTSCRSSHLLRSLNLSHNSAPPRQGFSR